VHKTTTTTEEREKVKLEVAKLKLEVKKIKLECKLTSLLTYKETLLVQKLEREMGVSPKLIDFIGSDIESDD
jgi:hypothetical protein